jgi:hypothetical protein
MIHAEPDVSPEFRSSLTLGFGNRDIPAPTVNMAVHFTASRSNLEESFHSLGRMQVSQYFGTRTTHPLPPYGVESAPGWETGVTNRQ